MSRINSEVEVTLDGDEAGVLLAAMVADGELTAEEAEARLLVTCRRAVAYEAGDAAVAALDRGDSAALESTGKLRRIERIVELFHRAVAALRSKLKSAGHVGTELN